MLISSDISSVDFFFFFFFRISYLALMDSKMIIIDAEYNYINYILRFYLIIEVFKLR
jgi:hypothetical protein